MKAYLINPFAQSITEVEYFGDFNQIYQFLNCDLFTTADINEFGDTVFVDDEGLISGKDQQFFLVAGYPQPLAGMGLVLGCNQEGESTEPSITLEQLKAQVDWIPPFMLRAFYA